MSEHSSAHSPPPPPPPPYEEAQPHALRGANDRKTRSPQEKLALACVQYEIHDEFAASLQHLQNVDIAVIVDDSTSMLEKSMTDGGIARSRWEELKDIVERVASVGSIYDDDGIQVHFLNRPTTLHHITPEKLPLLRDAFGPAPNGRTMIGERMRQVIHEYKGNKQLLLLVATDGEPSDEPTVLAVLSQLAAKGVRVNFLLCTEDDDVVRKYNRWDAEFGDLVDVTDDYYTERKQIRDMMGTSEVRFSRGDHVVKALVGAMDSSLDRKDEAKSVHPSASVPVISALPPLHYNDLHANQPIHAAAIKPPSQQNVCCSIM
jgi:hypothetical protein